MPASRTDVTAVVLTHRRPRLATEVVRTLVDVEGIDPGHVVVVVNGEGGLDDAALESTVEMLRLPDNLGPAGGFRAGMIQAFSDPATAWAYLCEDDVGLFDLAAPRLGVVMDRIAAYVDDAAEHDPPVGAVVAYGRRFTGRSGHTENVVPPAGAPALVPVDVAAWGATVLSRRVVDAGILPDPDWFFGYEDFDFFCRLRTGGFAVLADAEAARRVAAQQTSAGREAVLAGRRPVDAEEPWRAYYTARNFFALARRHGTPRWTVAHLAFSARRMQLARNRAERAATVRGLWDGVRGRLGRSDRYQP